MSEPVPLSQCIAEFINSLPAPDAEVRFRRQLCREAYDRGRADGYAEGREAERAGREWAGDINRAVLEARRWGPGGREHFADPRPGDYPGASCTPRSE